MTPIISPWIFYLMSVCGKAGCFLLVFTIIFFALSVIRFTTKTIIEDENVRYHDFFYDAHGNKLTSEESANRASIVNNERQKAKKERLNSAKKLAVAGLVFMTLFIIVPSKDTITYMVVAQNVTYENIDKAKISADKLVDYIIDKVDKLDNRGDKSEH